MSINDFEIIKQIGTGAFSTVSLVKSKKDNKIYALKRVELSKMKQNEKDNSLNEIRLLASVNHKNIIAYKESFYEESTNTLNLILEYADGGDLQTKISAHKNMQKYFNEKTIWSIFIQMVYGIKELHDRNIIHRDLKSANIFLMKNGICKLGDLNVSKEAKTGLLKTQTGTPYFASPEVWGGKPYGLKSDIWSLGCILYQMAALKMPFQGSNFKEVYNNVSKCKYQPLPSIYSKELDLIIKKLLQIDPDKRPNCKDILEDSIVIEKIKLLFNTNIYNNISNEENNVSKNDNDNDNKDNEESFDIIKKLDNDLKKEKNNKNSKYNNTSRLLKSLKCNKNDEIEDILPQNNGNKVYNNYRIFKNYDTNPSSNQEEEEKENKDNNKLNKDIINSNYNKKFYNKSNINKYKTINSNFLKQKLNLNKNADKSDSISKINNSIKSKTINKQNSVPYINHRSEGNNINKIKNNLKKEKEKENEKGTGKEKPKNDNQIKIPLLVIKNKPQLLKQSNSIPRNCFSAKNRRKALSENKNMKYYNNNNYNNQKLNIKNLNNYQYKKITPLNTNNDPNNSVNNIIDNQKKRLSNIVAYGYEFNQTDNDNKDTNNTSEKGKSFTYNKKLENKFHFNLSSKQKNKNSHSLSKNKNDSKTSEDINENTYNKQFRKSIPIGKNINKNTSATAIESYPVKPNIKVSNLFKESFNDFNSKINSYISNKINNSLHYTLNKKEVKRNNSTFQINNKEKQKILTLHKLTYKNNYSSNRLDIDLNNTSKNKYPIVGEKLTLPSTKGSESVSINNHNHSNISNHKKVFKKNINNINILECNHETKNECEKNIYNYSNTASNRVNIYRQNVNRNKNNNSLNNKNINNNIHKSISLVSIDRPGINKKQNNNKNKNNKNNNKEDNSRDNSDSIHKKISSFKFDEFKKKRLKQNNNFNERKNKLLKFNHMPFINTPNKENDPILTKQKEEASSVKQIKNNKDNNNNDIDPTIKILINPIKIIEKRNFKRKLFPVHPQVKLNKLNILNNTSYKNNNKDLES